MDKNHYLKSTFYTSNEHIIIIKLVDSSSLLSSLADEASKEAVRKRAALKKITKKREPDDVQSQVSIYIYMFQLL